MPSLPEPLTSRRHRAAAAVGLAVIVALSGATALAPGPVGVRPAAAATPSAPIPVDPGHPAVAAVTDDLPRAGASAAPAGPPATVTGRVPTGPAPTGPAITALAERGIPIVALEAYRRAAAVQAVERPTCHLGWTLVAAIGAIESGHGTHAGSRLYADGQDLPHVLGPVLDGTGGNARIADTDHGVLDGDRAFDRAVGPMQFIPSTWTLRGRDGNGDGNADPFNIVDAAVTTGDYLCRYGVDLGTAAGRTVAVFGYNHLDSYVATVLALEAAYADRPVVAVSTSPAAPPPAPAPRPTRGAPSPSPTPTPVRTTPVAPTPTPTATPTCPTPGPTGSASPTPSSSPTSSPTSTTGPTPGPTGCPTTSGPPTAPAASTSAVPSASTPVPSSAPVATAARPTPTSTPTT